jgi:hypothetical protein
VAEDVRADSKTPVEEIIIADESGRELMTLSAKDVLPEPCIGRRSRPFV